jgi:hypothetical protein
MSEILNYLYTTISTSLQSNQFFAGGVMLAVLSLIGYRLQALLNLIWVKIKTLTVFTVYLDDQDLNVFFGFSNWLKKHHPGKFKSVEAKCKITYNFETKKHVGEVILRQFQDVNLLWYKRRFILIYKERENFSSATQRENFFINKYIIKGFLAKKQIIDLLNEAVQISAVEYYKPSEPRFKFFTGDYWESKDIEEMFFKSFKNLYFFGKDKLVEELDRFKKSEEVYRRMGIAHKKGFLIKGPPGTGKSNAASAIAIYLGYSSYYLNLSAVKDDREIVRALSTVNGNCAIILEDIDRAFTGDNSQKFNIATLLNALDGNGNVNNCVIIMTTNFADRLDPALTRSGRIDSHIEIGYPRWQDVSDFMSDFYEEPTELTGNLGLKMTIADVQNICLSSGSKQEAIQRVKKLANEKL